MKKVFIVGDLHAPFDLDSYFSFCKAQYKKYNCNAVVFIGDVIDSHASSYHESDPDGMSAGNELEDAVRRLKRWHDAFPKADVILGNHDRIAARKIASAGLSKKWSKSLKEVLEVPTWTFHTKLEIDNVVYIHGEGATARTKATQLGKSVVQGHRHTESYVWNHTLEDKNIFGMQVGTGVDGNSYAFEYAKHFLPPAISCGVVLGKQAIVIPMEKK